MVASGLQVGKTPNWKVRLGAPCGHQTEYVATSLKLFQLEYMIFEYYVNPSDSGSAWPPHTAVELELPLIDENLRCY